MIDRVRHWLRQLYSQTGFRGPVLTLLSGTTIVMVISYSAQVVLTRLYTPDEFGVAEYFASLLAVLVSFTSLRYEDALMVPKRDHEAARIWWLALIVLFVFVALFAALLPWRSQIAALIEMPSMAFWLLFIPPALLIMRTAKLAELWLVRSKKYRHVSAGQVGNTMTTVSFRLAVGFPPVSAAEGGLIGGYIIGQATSLCLYGWYVARNHFKILLRAFSLREIAKSAKTYIRFPLFSTPSMALVTLIGRFPVLLMPFFFDEATIGLYGQAFRTLAIPLTLVGGAVSQVFFVHAAEAHRENRLSEVTATVHRRMVMLGVFPSLVAIVAGPDLFDVVFGSEWREAGRYVQMIAPWILFMAISSPLTRLFDVLERQRLDFATSLLMFIALGSAMIFGGMLGDIETTLLLIGIAGAGTRIIQLIVLLRLAHVKMHTALRAYFRYIIYSIPCLLIIGAVVGLTNQPWLTLGATALGGLMYASLVLWRDQLLKLNRMP